MIIEWNLRIMFVKCLSLFRKDFKWFMGFWNNGGFFSSVKGHVFKWWQLVIMPVLRINNNSRASQDVTQIPKQQNAPVMQQEAQSVQTVTITKQSMGIELKEEKVQATPTKTKLEEKQSDASGPMATEDPMEVLRRINEEKEEARRKGIEAARKKASEEARIAAIMNANKVDVNAFIEAGKAAKEEIAAKKANEKATREATDEELDKKQKQEDLRRAQEIMDRLNREAAEDEAKKQAEIEAAKQEAKKQFG